MEDYHTTEQQYANSICQAAMRGDLTTIIIVHEIGVSINLKGYAGKRKEIHEYPIVIAIMYHMIKVISWLISNDVNMDVKSSDGLSLIEVSEKYKDAKVHKLISVFAKNKAKEK